MASVRHLQFEKNRFLSNSHHRNGNLHLRILRTKFDRNRIIRDWDMEIKLFSKWRPSAILNLRKLPFSSRDRYLHAILILHLHSEICINRPIRPRDIAKDDFQYGVRRPSWIWKISIYRSNFHARIGNLHLCTKFDRNHIIHGWDMEMLFSKWRPSAVLNFGKLQFWSRNLYWHVILHLISEFLVDRPIRPIYISGGHWDCRFLGSTPERWA